jgi:hypothetical protein
VTRTVSALVLLLSAAATPVPPAVSRWGASIPAFYEKMARYLARETVHQEIFGRRTGDVARRRVLITDYQINHLLEEPESLWEFRFVRSVDGHARPGVDEEISRLAFLRHASATEERRQIVAIARRESLPGCGWHNLGLVLLAFREPYLPYFDWSKKGDHFEFRQARGPGIPEDFFDPQSPRHYPTGELWLAADGSASRLDLRYESEEYNVRMRFTFVPPAAGAPSMPRRVQVSSYRPSSTGGALESRVISDYSDYREFQVTTEESPGGSRP